MSRAHKDIKSQAEKNVAYKVSSQTGSSCAGGEVGGSDGDGSEGGGDDGGGDGDGSEGGGDEGGADGEGSEGGDEGGGDGDGSEGMLAQMGQVSGHLRLARFLWHFPRVFSLLHFLSFLSNSRAQVALHFFSIFFDLWHSPLSAISLHS